MITITVDNVEINVKNTLREITLGEFEILNDEFKKGETIVDKWVNVISYLTQLPKDRILLFPKAQFIELMDMMFPKEKEEVEKLKSLELDGKIYKAKLEPSAKDISFIENLLQKKKTNQLTMLIASQFVCEGENNDYESIEKRAKLIKDLPAYNLIAYAIDSVFNFLDFLAASNNVHHKGNG